MNFTGLLSGPASSPLSLSTNLSNPLLGSSSLRSSSGLTLSSQTTLSLSPLKLSSFTPSTRHAETGVRKGDSQPIQSGGTGFKPFTTPVIETGLTKLSLSKDKKAARSDNSKTVAVLKDIPRKRHTDSTLKTVKKSKVQSASGVIKSEVFKAYDVAPPDYAIKCEKEDDFMDVDLLKFIPPSKDVRLSEGVGRTITDIISAKVNMSDSYCEIFLD